MESVKCACRFCSVTSADPDVEFKLGHDGDYYCRDCCDYTLSLCMEPLCPIHLVPRIKWEREWQDNTGRRCRIGRSADGRKWKEWTEGRDKWYLERID